ncbi:MAG: 30S ribosomal protein S21 [Bacteroidia bacterium]|nr:30S ribosomal protein S21 [Bacteroidia bacterium]
MRKVLRNKRRIYKFTALSIPSREEVNNVIIIKVKEGESVDRALRRYKKKFEKTGILKEVRGRMFYRKPSEEKKEVEKKAINRQRHYAIDNF